MTEAVREPKAISNEAKAHRATHRRVEWTVVDVPHDGKNEPGLTDNKVPPALTPLPNQPHKTPATRWQIFLRDYAWWIAKNLLGYFLILISPVLGAAVPGPGGIPIFLIGFALITFPGKRRLTARVFRGIPIDIRGSAAGISSGMGACLLPIIAAIILRVRFERILTNDVFHSWWTLGLVLGSIAVSFFIMRLGIHGVNLVIRLMPVIRRRARPWMRRKGIDLLPPRRRRRLRLLQPGAIDQEILEIDPRHGERAARLWKSSRPWLLGGALAAAVALVAVKVFA